MIKPNNGKFRAIAMLAIVLVVAIGVISRSQKKWQLKDGYCADKAAMAAGVGFGGECEELVIGEFRAAKSEIRIAIFTFSRRDIAAALTDAAGRGVKITIKYDQDSYNSMDGMKEVIDMLKKRGIKCHGIQMRRDRASMHHKFAIVDNRRVLTGSYNYTTTATKENYENLVVVEGDEVVRAFSREFERIK